MNERKYEIKDGKIVKRRNEVPIPDDEPLFIFRAKDRKALAALVAYNMICDKIKQRESITKSIFDFREFQEKHPERMGEPAP